MLEKLKTETVFLHGNLDAERAGHARSLKDSTCFQRDSQKVIEEREEAVWLLAIAEAMRENSAVIDQLKKNISTATVKAAAEVGALIT